MLITYLIFLILAVLFKTLHIPGVALWLVLSMFLPIFDVLIQMLRRKEEKDARVWSAVAMVFWSIFFLFKFLHWPGTTTLFVLAIIFSAIYFMRVIQKRKAVNYRFYVLLLVVTFGVFNFTMTDPKFRIFYMTEDPFNGEEQVPHFIRQKLAYSLYKEGDYKKAQHLIQLNIEHLERLLAQKKISRFEKEIDEENLQQSILDLEMIKKGTWDDFTPLIPEDREE